MSPILIPPSHCGANSSGGCVSLTVRIDTAIEAQYYKNGGIMPYVLRNILK